MRIIPPNRKRGRELHHGQAEENDHANPDASAMGRHRAAPH